MTPQKNGMGSHQSTRMETDVWLTPPEILEDLGPFDLDPCASLNRPWDTAAKHYTIDDDGLAQPWEGFVWMNPPYGRQTGTWLERLALHGHGIALIFARTETRMFTEHVWPHASALRFLAGRVTFRYPDGTPAPNNGGAPSVLIGYGTEARYRLTASTLPGYTVYPHPLRKAS